MVFLGYMLPTSEKYETKLKIMADMNNVSVEKMLEFIIDDFEKKFGGK
jgi:hypothetical protein